MFPKRVLVIDDEADVRTVVQGCLEDIGGWSVMTAASGQEGLAQVMMSPPDAILLDMMMPEMDGFTFLTHLRTQLAEISIPIVLLTAKINLPQATELARLNVKGIVPKPFDPFRLTEQVAVCLGWEIEA
ncbi:MAG: response regulator [Elainella sp.]